MYDNKCFESVSVYDLVYLQLNHNIAPIPLTTHAMLYCSTIIAPTHKNLIQYSIHNLPLVYNTPQ